ncbi:MAG: class I SAM-dependent methyltransferase [Candidatus Nitrospinota bacterium M3_3B_026]
MARDKHLGTGEYEPGKYWSARAKASGGSLLQAVCVFGATERENEAAARIQEAALRKTLKYVDLNGKNALEYGCGAGRWIDFFLERGAVWHGVDISAEMISMLKEKYGGAKANHITGGGIPHPAKSMDFVYSITVIHHNPYETQEEIAAEMAHVLKDGGRLLILEGVGDKGFFNYFPRTKEGWAGLFEKHGMTLVHQEGMRNRIFSDLARLAKHKIFSKKIKLSDVKISPSSFAGRVAGWLDLVIGPCARGLPPERYRTSVVMLFEKKGGPPDA